MSTPKQEVMHLLFSILSFTIIAFPNGTIDLNTFKMVLCVVLFISYHELLGEFCHTFFHLKSMSLFDIFSCYEVLFIFSFCICFMQDVHL